MPIEEIRSCPLGSECKKIVQDKIHKCMWLVELRGQDAQGKDQDKEECAIAWQPILMLESSRHNIVNTAAINSLRNETVKRQDAAIALQVGLVGNAKQVEDLSHEDNIAK